MTRVKRLSEIYSLVEGRHGLFLANHHDSFVGRALIEYGEYSKDEWDVLAQLCPVGGFVIEVGANVGTHTVPFAKAVGPAGQVIAIEPQPFLHQNLCANIALNSLTNVLTYQCGCGAASEQMTIPIIDYTVEGNFGGVSLGKSETGFSVDVRPLDSLLPSRTVTLLKVDVEGMEQDVLAGAARLIEKYNPVLYLENDRVSKSQSLIEYVWNLGYDAWWHLPKLYSKNNFFENDNDHYENIVSVNIICISKNAGHNVTGFKKVTDSTEHPIRR